MSAMGRLWPLRVESGHSEPTGLAALNGRQLLLDGNQLFDHPLVGFDLCHRACLQLCIGQQQGSDHASQNARDFLASTSSWSI